MIRRSKDRSWSVKKQKLRARGGVLLKRSIDFLDGRSGQVQDGRLKRPILKNRHSLREIAWAFDDRGEHGMK